MALDCGMSRREGSSITAGPSRMTEGLVVTITQTHTTNTEPPSITCRAEGVVVMIPHKHTSNIQHRATVNTGELLKFARHIGD